MADFSKQCANEPSPPDTLGTPEFEARSDVQELKQDGKVISQSGNHLLLTEQRHPLDMD